ncbi:MAG: hypothetical protein LBP58_08145 [Azoarcus sp.]|nr:hypothetical protein [Azoarcus sp.]
MVFEEAQFVHQRLESHVALFGSQRVALWGLVGGQRGFRCGGQGFEGGDFGSGDGPRGGLGGGDDGLPALREVDLFFARMG